MSYVLDNKDFESIHDSHSRQMLENAYNAITMAGGWDFMKTFSEESFMFSSHPMVNSISDAMINLGYNGHSGASFGWTMRSMEYLSKHGKEAFLTMFNK